FATAAADRRACRADLTGCRLHDPGWPGSLRLTQRGRRATGAFVLCRVGTCGAFAPGGRRCRAWRPDAIWPSRTAALVRIPRCTCPNKSIGSSEPPAHGAPMFDTAPQLDCAGRVLRLDRPRVMGIVNATPDSFSDGGVHFDTDAAVAHGLRLAAEGADILDVGGESTRPGAEEVPLDEELRRVVPVIARLARETDLPISVDTSKPEVMRAAVE